MPALAQAADPVESADRLAPAPYRLSSWAPYNFIAEHCWKERSG